MWVTDSVTQAALISARPFEMDLKASLLTPSGVVSFNVIDEQATVMYALGQSTGLSAAFVVDRSLLNQGYFNVLTDKVYLRANLGSGLSDIPLFTGRVLQPSDREDGYVTVKCVGVADDVVNCDFRSAWSTSNGTVDSEITAIIQDVDLGFEVETVGSFSVAPPLTWDINRAQALNDLADGGSAIWQDNRTGGFTVYANPYSVFPTPAAGLTLRDGVNGTIVHVNHTQARQYIYNMVTVVVERTDGSAPIRVSVFDNDPNSDTYFGGSFGRRNKTIKVQMPIDYASAVAVGYRLLQQSLALTETWEVTCPFMPLVDQGDILGVYYDGVVHATVVESVTINLAASGETKLTCRRIQFIDITQIGIM